MALLLQPLREQPPQQRDRNRRGLSIATSNPPLLHLRQRHRRQRGHATRILMMGTCSMRQNGAVSLIATCLRLAHEGQKRPSLGRKRLPLGQGSQTAKFEGLAIDEMTLRVEMVVK